MIEPSTNQTQVISVTLRILDTVRMTNGDMAFVLVEIPGPNQTASGVYAVTKTDLEKVAKITNERYVDIENLRLKRADWTIASALQEKGMVAIGALPVAELEKTIRRNYLTYLFVQLQRSFRKDKQKLYTKEAVFAAPVLLMLEAVYFHLYGRNLREELAQSNFEYARKTLYAEMPGREDLFNVQRTLWYYPNHALVTVRWAIGANSADALISKYDNLDGSPPTVVSTPHALFAHYTHHRGDGWISFSRMWKADEKLKKVLEAYMENYDLKCIKISGT